MKLIQIQYFLKIAECRSITKAAEQLFVSQPALSKQMAQLEEELQVSLLKRTPSGIKLTLIGEELADDLRHVTAELDRVVQKAVSSGKQGKRALYIGIFDGALDDVFLPKLYSFFERQHPEVQLKLQSHSISENRQLLETGELDMAIEPSFPSFSQPEENDNYLRKTLASRKGAIIYSKRSPLAEKSRLTLKDFEKETFFFENIGRDTKETKNWIKTLDLLGIHPEIEEVDNYLSLISNIRLGQGFGILSGLLVETEPDLLAFDLPGDNTARMIAVWPKTDCQLSGIMQDYQAFEG